MGKGESPGVEMMMITREIGSLAKRGETARIEENIAETETIGAIARREESVVNEGMTVRIEERENPEKRDADQGKIVDPVKTEVEKEEKGVTVVSAEMMESAVNVVNAGNLKNRSISRFMKSVQETKVYRLSPR